MIGIVRFGTTRKGRVFFRYRMGQSGDVLALAGAWSDFDFKEMLNTLDHIRHDSKPTPPFSLDL